MITTLHELHPRIIQLLGRWGFSAHDSELLFHNMLLAEVAGKKSHGFSQLFWFKDVVTGKYGPISISKTLPTIAKETPTSIVVDGNENTGYVVMDFAVTEALNRVKMAGQIAVTLTRTAPTIGYISEWALRVTEKGYIFMCFSNAGNSTTILGSKEKLVGTNPISIGIPSNDSPVILDMATAAATYATIKRASRLGQQLPTPSGIDVNGNQTTDPNAILEGGSLIPFGGYKGAGLSLIVELLAGALTGSKTGKNGVSYWGTYFMIIDPAIFGNVDEFYKRVNSYIEEIKTAQTFNGDTIHIPGESLIKQYSAISPELELDVDDNFLESISSL